MNWSEPERLEVESLLKSRNTLVLATSDQSGSPHIAPVYFSMMSALSLDFVSKTNTRHIQDLELRNSVAGSVFEEGTSLTDITGLQMKGTVLRIRDEEEKTARDNYLGRYPELKQNKVLLTLFHTLPIFRFKPIWIRMSDHQVTGIRKREWSSN